MEVSSWAECEENSKVQIIVFKDTYPLNSNTAKSQVVLELVSSITLWTLWKQVFPNQTTQSLMLMQEIWSEVVVTLKS